MTTTEWNDAVADVKERIAENNEEKKTIDKDNYNPAPEDDVFEIEKELNAELAELRSHYKLLKKPAAKLKTEIEASIEERKKLERRNQIEAGLNKLAPLLQPQEGTEGCQVM